MKVLSISFNKSVLTFLMTLFCSLGFSINGSARGLPDFTELVKESSPAVVNIRTTSSSNGGNFGPGIPGVPQLDENDPMYEFFKDFFRQETINKELLHGDRGLPVVRNQGCRKRVYYFS